MESVVLKENTRGSNDRSVANKATFLIANPTIRISRNLMKAKAMIISNSQPLPVFEIASKLCPAPRPGLDLKENRV